MKCQEAKTVIARWQGPTPAERDELSLHLRSCSECAAVARSQRLTRSLLEILTPDQEASPHFFTRLRARLREVERPASHSHFPLKALVPALASLTVILASATYLLSPPPPSPVLSFLDSSAGGSGTFSFLGIPRPTHDQILASILEAEERMP